MQQTTHMLLIWHVWARVTAILPLSYPGLNFVLCIYGRLIQMHLEYSKYSLRCLHFLLQLRQWFAQSGTYGNNKICWISFSTWLIILLRSDQFKKSADKFIKALHEFNVGKGQFIKSLNQFWKLKDQFLLPLELFGKPSSLLTRHCVSARIICFLPFYYLFGSVNVASSTGTHKIAKAISRLVFEMEVIY